MWTPRRFAVLSLGSLFFVKSCSADGFFRPLELLLWVVREGLANSPCRNSQGLGWLVLRWLGLELLVFGYRMVMLKCCIK